MPTTTPAFSELAAQLAPTVIEHRRTLHEIPELSFAERLTADYIAAVLVRMGLTPRRGIAGTTGLSVELPGAGPGPTVLIRADMDGLPIEEAVDHQPRSHHPGCMHACGHDGHMAIVLGVAEGFRRLAHDQALPGRVVLIFQPAEESGGGAARLIEAGLLESERIDYVLGLHLWSFLERGAVIIPDRTVMASADEFLIELQGKGGHGALPHQATDTVLGLAHVVTALQSIVARNVDPLRSAVVTVGKMTAGHAPNVLPERGELLGTFRAPDAETRALLRRRIEEVTLGVAGALGLVAKVTFLPHGYPPTVNDPQVARVVRGEAAQVLGAAAVHEGPPTMAGEDFSFYLERRPGCFMLLGMRDEQAGVIHPHHSPHFRIHEAVLAQGVEILLRSAWQLQLSATAK